MTAVRKLLEEALTLPTDDRARVAAALIASLDQGEDVDAEQAWATEIQGRPNVSSRVSPRGPSGKTFESVSWL